MSSAAQALEFGLPVTCELGHECFVQNYADRQAGEGYQDYRCGHLSYPDHKGTDFRIPTLREMQAGEAVVAAADGVVRATRDGMADALLSEKGRDAIRKRECGNSVAITHANGWETLYCHMRRHSVRVKKGDKVAQGQPLGLIGLSGATEFPHVHFQVSHEGRILDPFTGESLAAPCGAEAAHSLWSTAAAKKLAYHAGGLVTSGFSSQQPTLAGIVKGQFAETTIAADAPAIIFWAQSYGLRLGDHIALSLIGPDGAVLAENKVIQPENQAVSFQVLGVRNHGRMQSGRYRGVYRVIRDGVAEPVSQHEQWVSVP
ncbi:MAG: M23 family metallopeptidase [Rickettsiales bacterium]|nr:M23 family metallopeptidase [Rickettsiales bacterium]